MEEKGERSLIPGQDPLLIASLDLPHLLEFSHAYHLLQESKEHLQSILLYHFLLGNRTRVACF